MLVILFLPSHITTRTEWTRSRSGIEEVSQEGSEQPRLIRGTVVDDRVNFGLEEAQSPHGRSLFAHLAESDPRFSQLENCTTRHCGLYALLCSDLERSPPHDLFGRYPRKAIIVSG
jgi:hypothetical protein